MLFKKIKDLSLRKKFNKIEKLKIIQKHLIIKIPTLNNLNKESLFFSLNSKIKKHSLSKVKIVRRCVLNNRGRGVLRPYNISRIILRELMQFSILPGYAKAVW